MPPRRQKKTGEGKRRGKTRGGQRRREEMRKEGGKRLDDMIRKIQKRTLYNKKS